MDKYTKAFMMIFKIPIGLISIFAGLALIGVSVWVSTFSDVASMILLMALLGGGCIINFGIGYIFLGDEYKATHLVRDGNTVFAPVETPKFLKRRKIVTFIGFIAYILLAVYYIIRIILDIVLMEKLINIDYSTSIIALILYALAALVFAFGLFMIYKRTKHIDLKEEEN